MKKINDLVYKNRFWKVYGKIDSAKVKLLRKTKTKTQQFLFRFDYGTIFFCW